MGLHNEFFGLFFQGTFFALRTVAVDSEQLRDKHRPRCFQFLDDGRIGLGDTVLVRLGAPGRRDPGGGAANAVGTDEGARFGQR